MATITPSFISYKDFYSNWETKCGDRIYEVNQFDYFSFLMKNYLYYGNICSEYIHFFFRSVNCWKNMTILKNK